MSIKLNILLVSEISLCMKFHKHSTTQNAPGIKHFTSYSLVENRIQSKTIIWAKWSKMTFWWRHYFIIIRNYLFNQKISSNGPFINDFGNNRNLFMYYSCSNGYSWHFSFNRILCLFINASKSSSLIRWKIQIILK